MHNAKATNIILFLNKYLPSWLITIFLIRNVPSSEPRIGSALFAHPCPLFISTSYHQTRFTPLPKSAIPIDPRMTYYTVSVLIEFRKFPSHCHPMKVPWCNTHYPANSPAIIFLASYLTFLAPPFLNLHYFFLIKYAYRIFLATNHNTHFPFSQVEITRHFCSFFLLSPVQMYDSYFPSTLILTFQVWKHPNHTVDSSQISLHHWTF